MPVFVILIIVSLAFYVYFKIQYFRTKKPMLKHWISAKSSIALGLFVAFFGINQFIVHPSTISTVIGAVFLLVGIASMWAGYKAYQFYLPRAEAEANEKL